LLLTFVLTVPLAALTYRWIEMPLLNLKNRYFSLKPASRPG
jgi:peptidoglycan/LPS O-acetylase OafA/YrhL